MSSKIEGFKTGVKKRKKLKIIAIILAIAIIAFVLYMIFKPDAPANMTMGGFNQAIELRKTEIKESLSLSGVVYSDDSKNVYTSLSYKVDEILVDVGDKVKKGQELIKLDTKNLEDEITSAENNLASARTSLNSELRSLKDSIESAENSLKSALLSKEKLENQYAQYLEDLKEAEDDVKDPFDSYSYDKSVNDAKTNLERRTEDLEEAQDDLEEAKNNFDDYSYQNSITEAKVTLDKRKDDLKKAKEELLEQKNNFDDYTYKNSIETARTSLDRAKSQLSSAESSDYSTYIQSTAYESRIASAQAVVQSAKLQYEQALAAAEGNSSNPSVQMAKSEWDSAQNSLNSIISSYNSLNASSSNNASSVNSAKQAVEDAERAYENAVETLERAKDDAVEKAEDAVEDAETILADAQRAYDRTLSDLEKAKENAVESMTDALKSAQRSYDDAKTAYEKAVSDRKKAKEDAAEAAEDKLKSVKRSVTDAENSLESADISIANAQSNLKQAQLKESTAGNTVKNQEISLQKLRDNLEDCIITATIDGTVTAVNAVEGTAASGVLLTIENDGILYVSVNVMEYNLDSVKIGQEVDITTVATGDQVFAGVVTYISPAAVSAAGSTSVEFEVWAEFLEPTEQIKIGMNAFADIITARATDIYAVPSTAILEKDGKYSVYCDINDIVTEIEVKKELEAGSQVQIVGEGLRDGLRILPNPALYTPGESISAARENMQSNIQTIGGGSRMSGGMGGMGGSTNRTVARASR